LASKPPLYDLEQEHLLGTAIGFAVFAYPPIFGGLFFVSQKNFNFFQKGADYFATFFTTAW
jgi:hypothetical protein